MSNRLIYCEECENYYYNSNIDKHYNTKKHKINYFIMNKDEHTELIINDDEDLKILSNPRTTNKQYINIIKKHI